MSELQISLTHVDGRRESLPVGCGTEQRIYPDDRPPRLGLVIGTYAARAYVQLQLETWTRHCPHVPVLVHDDNSNQQLELRELCHQYGAAFSVNSERCTHYMGDLSVFYSGLHWARRQGIELLVKFSRRFVPTHDWTPDLVTLARVTQCPTFSNVCQFNRFRFRTECLGLHVPSWDRYGITEQLRRTLVSRPPVFVETYMHQRAVEVLKTCGCTEALAWAEAHPPTLENGYAPWPLLGTSRTEKVPGLLWWNACPPEEYWRLSHSWGLPWGAGEFKHVVR